MSDTWMWVLAAHLIGVFLWIGGLFSTYWLVRIHASAPKDVHERLTLMERSLALMMDIAATLAIGTGIFMALDLTPNLFKMPHSGWFHTKLAIVVLGILPVHGIVRARIAKFSRGESPSVPQWAWSLLLAALCAIVILVVKKPF
ncbi:MAG TPA: CopD family protein [Kofleriaceae bacterium]|nr:CopD family protein [Kofleriaceae bacterium]